MCSTLGYALNNNNNKSKHRIKNISPHAAVSVIFAGFAPQIIYARKRIGSENYRIAGNFCGDFNLANWRFFFTKSPKLIPPNTQTRARDA